MGRFAEMVWSMIRSPISLHHKHLLQMRKTGIATWARHLFNCHFKVLFLADKTLEPSVIFGYFWDNLLEISKTQPSRACPKVGFGMGNMVRVVKG